MFACNVLYYLGTGRKKVKYFEMFLEMQYIVVHFNVQISVIVFVKRKKDGQTFRRRKQSKRF